MEERKVILTVEEYTELIKENTCLKMVVESYKRKILADIEDEIKTSLINSLNIEETKKWLEEDKAEAILNKFMDYNSSWKYESIATNNYNIMSPKEIKQEVITQIKKLLNGRLNDLNDNEE